MKEYYCPNCGAEFEEDYIDNIFCDNNNCEAEEEIECDDCYNKFTIKREFTKEYHVIKKEYEEDKGKEEVEIIEEITKNANPMVSRERIRIGEIIANIKNGDMEVLFSEEALGGYHSWDTHAASKFIETIFTENCTENIVFCVDDNGLYRLIRGFEPILHLLRFTNNLDKKGVIMPKKIDGELLRLDGLWMAEPFKISIYNSEIILKNLNGLYYKDFTRDLKRIFLGKRIDIKTIGLEIDEAIRLTNTQQEEYLRIGSYFKEGESNGNW